MTGLNRPEYIEQCDLLLKEAIDLLSEVMTAKTLHFDISDSLKENAGFVGLRDTLLDVREFIMALADGDLSRTLKHKGYIPGVLKGLQASLRHLT